jgi:alkylresorcinol/alkylpyrone synthase
MFSETYRDVERLLPIFDNANIDNRHFCVPPEWFGEDHTFPEKNALYIKHALDLSEKAATRALDKVGVAPEEVGAIFFVSTTGISTPSLDSKLIFRLGMSEQTRRVPVWGLGCAGGAGGLARAADYVRAYPEKPVLLVGVELCGLTFVRVIAPRATWWGRASSRTAQPRCSWAAKPVGGDRSYTAATVPPGRRPRTSWAGT